MIKSDNDIKYIECGANNHKALFLTRSGGFSTSPYDTLNLSYNCGDDKSSVDKNYAKLFKTFNIQAERLITLNQVHGDDLLVIRRGDKESVKTGSYDATVTDDPKLALSIMTADCVPVLLFDAKSGVHSAVHAGWRGTALGIVKKVVGIMADEFLCDRKNIRAYIGPAIGLCCYEVSCDLLGKLNGSVANIDGDLYRIDKGRPRVDLKKYNARQLLECGVDSNSIEIIDLCTACLDDMFFSYRKRSITGRQMSIAIGSCCN